MKKGQEIYLVSFALVLLAVILLYDLYSIPELSPAVVKKTAGISNYSDTTSQYIEDTQHEVLTQPIKSEQTVSSSTSKIININTANVQELTTLNGIGEVKANAIINYRTENGYYNSVDELINVKGIGEKTIDKIRTNITV
ncbi:MAG: ComEA family DNA-binding protein [Clostridia bacterium]|nr:ComEA family DNA-binding protein [Clostridia bacterium]